MYFYTIRGGVYAYKLYSILVLCVHFMKYAQVQNYVFMNMIMTWGSFIFVCIYNAIDNSQDFNEFYAHFNFFFLLCEISKLIQLLSFHQVIFV